MPGDQVTQPDQTHITKEPAGTRLALFIAWFGGGIAWSLYHVIGYAVSSVACTLGVAATTVSAAVLTLSLIFALLAVAALLVSRRPGRRYRSPEEDADADRGVSVFTGFAAVILNGFFAALILYDGIAAIVLRPC